MNVLSSSAKAILLTFFIAHVFGLFFINTAFDFGQGILEVKQTDFLERPELDSTKTAIYILVGILIGTLLLLLIAKFNKVILWKLWFYSASFVGIFLALSIVFPDLLALLLTIILVFLKYFIKNNLLYNFTEILFYSGLVVFLAPLLDIFTTVLLLIIISLYDAYAVWKSKHMITMANFTAKTKIFPGINYNYSDQQLATNNSNQKKFSVGLLGGGDIIFSLLVTAVLFKELLISGAEPLLSVIVPIFSTFALYLLFKFSNKNSFYPAMPFISAGCFLAVGIVFLLI